MRNHPPTVTLGASERSRYSPGPLHGLPTSHSDAAYLNLEEACLLRHFTQNLAQWFDISDRDRHFALHVPERAMFCPVLRYAVYTASAGHLNRLASCGKSLETLGFPEEARSLLSPETAIRYHDICISYLFEISHDPEEEYNEDVLTAATILRFYEQIEAPSLGDSEAYLNAIQFNVNTQQDESFYAWFKIHGPSRDINVHACPSVSLRHSAALSALRQEIWSAFLYQREFRLPVSPTNDYTMCDAANDFIWTNRILVWVADLLLFCFGDNHRSSAEERLQRWSKLKTVEERWKEAKPAPYKPIHYRHREPMVGKHFPEIWHMNSCQVAGAQHIELGRILLAVSDPRRASRLGLGALSRDKALVQELQDCTRRLCGLAVSNPPCPAALVTAMVGISICGEYFTDPGEQAALIRLLEGLEWDHAWPTASTINALQTAWGSPI
ncbi:uncharacterized protein BO66DRAFT_383898 [Aspergillus aculeatinus CBS 121060]|uniref:Uncharacterized protein n=1 Tax=Aspergillus aculeatinus CBS 121060 TaxID=1448322 RepID=A0ACD1GVD1_9EURO|nr:hypothetical protein BO66DRAFT_383898 [Aspergillus aculeatinus CBS 121060]RAH65275.1 hypothetical protein BO66DRAFT_383898 [Aspergillus aculeatinus CBS 121060]